MTERDRDFWLIDDDVFKERNRLLQPPIQSPSSGMNAQLLSEAINDAKAVRATALKNARIALEEAFSQRFHEMFVQKLQEESERKYGNDESVNFE